MGKLSSHTNAHANSAYLPYAEAFCCAIVLSNSTGLAHISTQNLRLIKQRIEQTQVTTLSAAFVL